MHGHSARLQQQHQLPYPPGGNVNAPTSPRPDSNLHHGGASHHPSQGMVTMSPGGVASGTLSTQPDSDSNYLSNHGLIPSNNQGSGSLSPSFGGIGGTSDRPSKVILLTVSNVLIPVTIDHIQKIFFTYGDVKKVILFTKNDQFKALVELPSAEAASRAVAALQNKFIFEGCNQLSLTYSLRNEIQIRYNGPKSWDFTTALSGGGPAVGGSNGSYSNGNSPGIIGVNGSTTSTGSVLSMPYMNKPVYNPPHMTGASGGPTTPNNPVLSGGPTSHAHGGGSIPMHNPMGRGPHPHRPPAMLLGQDGLYTGMGNQAMTNPSSSGTMNTLSHLHTPVLIVHGIPEDFDCDAIFTLFGVYGDVQRVKILYHHRHSAMVEFTTPQEAARALQMLNKLTLLGHELVIQSSRATSINVPLSAQADRSAASLTKEYSNSKVHRYKDRYTRSRNIHPPSNVVHVSNIPAGTTEEEVASLVVRALNHPSHHPETGELDLPITEEEEEGKGHKYALSDVNVAFFQRDRRMAYILLPSVEQATLLIIRAHNYRYKQQYLRLAYSNKDQRSIATSTMAMGTTTPIPNSTTTSTTTTGAGMSHNSDNNDININNSMNNNTLLNNAGMNNNTCPSNTSNKNNNTNNDSISNNNNNNNNNNTSSTATTTTTSTTSATTPSSQGHKGSNGNNNNNNNNNVSDVNGRDEGIREGSNTSSIDV